MPNVRNMIHKNTKLCEKSWKHIHFFYSSQFYPINFHLFIVNIFFTLDVHTWFQWENLRERDHLQDLGIYGKIMINRIFNKLTRVLWTGLIWLKIRTSSRLLWTRNELSGSVKCQQFLKKKSDLRSEWESE